LQPYFDIFTLKDDTFVVIVGQEGC